ncbi:unnamed protein product [Gordionus sp. m RMFG-2023]|uniref:copper homeostasis protein cutC homolog isoform X2 n=1 Tax=Gordionus sp. m RMFG-2023 TaxID=3053472 RepID=UPI0030E53005
MEICVDNIESALIAYKNGASRIELCSALELDGLTPNIGMFKIIKSLIKIPIFIMIRPREEDIKIFKEMYADGFVFGVLTKNLEVDMEINKTLINVCHPVSATFHRAFDVVKNPLQALDSIALLGFDRILTSGCYDTALQGNNLLTELIQKTSQTSDNIKWPIIVLASGIDRNNLAKILTATKCQELHSSCRVKKLSEKKENFDHYSLPDASIITKMIDIAKEFNLL